MGQLRYFLVPRELELSPGETEDGWGLLELRGKQVFVVRLASVRDWDAAAAREELKLLVARNAYHLTSDCVRCSSILAERKASQIAKGE